MDRYCTRIPTSALNPPVQQMLASFVVVTILLTQIRQPVPRKRRIY